MRGKGNESWNLPMAEARAPGMKKGLAEKPLLTAVQRQILEFIRCFIDERGYVPSVREIQEGCGLSSTSVAHYNLQALARMGYLRRSPDVARGLELLWPRSRRHRRTVLAPLVGTITAGEPMPVANEEAWSPAWEDVLELPADLVGGRQNVFAVRVRGNSMIDALVGDGDIVVLERPALLRDGDMVAAWLKREGEATLKRFYREGRKVRLQPENPAYSSIVTDARNVEVQGRVVAVLRLSG
jgi:repressor LexA